MHPLQSYLVGASGGCYALVAAHLANVIINWGEMPFNWARLLVLITLMVTDIGVFAYMTITNTNSKVRRHFSFVYLLLFACVFSVHLVLYFLFQMHISLKIP